MNSRHWTINGRFLQQAQTGVQRCAREIIRYLDRELEQKNQLTDNLNVELLIPPGADPLDGLNRIAVKAVGPAGAGGHSWEQIHLPRAAAGRGLLSLCNVGPVLHSHQVVCIHDMNTRLVPGSYSFPFRAFYRLIVPLLGRTARRITTVSEFSASQLLAYGVCSGDKLTVIPNGKEHAVEWRPLHSEATQSVAGKSTILLLASKAPHKNIAMLAQLAGKLAARGLKLAIAGVKDPRIFSTGDVAGDDGQRSGLVWLGRIRDEEFAALLDDCLCLALPSLTEGFGLPPLEAMARGCPVVVSDRASLPEVCGPAALYAAADDPDAWLMQFDKLSASPQLQKELAIAGRERASSFSWRHAAQKYLQAMADVDGLAASPVYGAKPNVDAF